jgi:hypothetical protein
VLLRRVHADRAAARALGAVARADMATHWTWERPAKIIAGRLAELAPDRMGSVRTAVAPNGSAARVIVDADLFTDTGRPLELDALLARLPSTTGFTQRSQSVAHRPAYHLPSYDWYRRQLPSSRPAQEEDVTLSWLRRSDTVSPTRPGRGRWIVCTGDCVLTSVPAHLVPVLRDADDVWVPHGAAFAACEAAGLAADRLFVLPLLSRAIDPQSGSAWTAMPPVPESTLTFGLLVTTDEELAVADGLVRLWERAFAGRADRTLRIVLGPAPSAAVADWMAQLMTRLQRASGDEPTGGSARTVRRVIHGVSTVVSEDEWPWVLRALDVLITPSGVPSVPSVWPVAAALGVPLISARHDQREVWCTTAGGWTVPVASTGRFEWPAFAAACEVAGDPAQRAERARMARAAYAALPDEDTFAEAIRSRLGRGR